MPLERNPSTGILAVAAAIEMSRTTCVASRILQRVQSLLHTDHSARVGCAKWFLQKCTQDLRFPSYLLFIDGEYVSQEGVFNRLNANLWDYEKPQGVRLLLSECLGRFDGDRLVGLTHCHLLKHQQSIASFWTML